MVGKLYLKKLIEIKKMIELAIRSYKIICLLGTLLVIIFYLMATDVIMVNKNKPNWTTSKIKNVLNKIGSLYCFQPLSLFLDVSTKAQHKSNVTNKSMADLKQ